MQRTQRSGRRVERTDGYYSMVPEWILDSDEISDRAVRLWAVLDRYAGRSAECFPSRTTLAKRLRKSVDTIDRAVAELVAAGALEVEREQGRVSVYRLVSRPRRISAGGTGRTDAAPTRRTDAAQNESQGNERQENERTPSVADATVDEVGHALPDYDPLRGKRVDGRNLPWDALVEETVSHGQANEVRVGAALKSIRAEWWAEAEKRGLPVEIVRAHWQEFEQTLAAEIRRRVRWLKTEKPDLTWGAEGVARWWSRIPAEGATEASIAEAVARVRSAREA